MSDIFSDCLAITHRREGLLYSASQFFFTGKFSQFSKSVCFALKPRFSFYVFALENNSGNTEQTNLSRISFLWYLLPMNFILFLCILIIFIQLGNGNVNIFPHRKINKLPMYSFVILMY